ncbi:unnamed protein product [Effrenium voratum]|uniref:Uncharacterized protein n=1 Tax=Effrenium voratum TaxID=2562239 RepID=A0AA36IJ20_9DINO|nr:unnamed protein product [Effrenium voratum]
MWWANGLRFGCTACGRCCVRRVPSASAPLAEAEIDNLAQALGLSPSRFLAQYAETADFGGAARLKVDETGRCALLTAMGKCSVHEARPAACRTYPYWPENLASPYEWAREAVLCEGIKSSWEPEEPGSVTETARVIEDELLVEELRVGGVLRAENWTHAEAMEYIHSLREAKMPDLDLDPLPAPRKVLFHSQGLVVLETEEQDLPENQSASRQSGVVRSLHFESSIGIVQTEVRYHPEHGFDHDQLMFGVHSAFLEVVKEQAAQAASDSVIVLGGGGGVLPMALQKAALRDRNTAGPFRNIRNIICVEKDPEVAKLGKDFFGMGEGGEEVNVRLVIEDARHYVTPSLSQGAPDAGDILAILVDIAGDLQHSSGGEVLAPCADFRLGDFVRSAVAAVRPDGVIAWNVLVSELGEDRWLQSAVEGIQSAVQDEHFSVVSRGPIRRNGGVAQWLLIGSWKTSAGAWTR